MTTVTAIVPTYNRRAYLSEAIDSIEAQVRTVDQIIIWDDGSTDGTEAYVRARAAAQPSRILYRRSENRGKSSALNAALAEATGDLIWICDDDDVSLPIAVSMLEKALERSNAAVAAGRHERFRTNPETGVRELIGTGYWPDLKNGSILRHLLEDIFFFQNAALVRRNAYDRVGPFREDLDRSIDYEMFVRLASRFPIELVDEVLFLQRKHEGARGPATARHEAKKSEMVWESADRRIFSEFRAVLPIELYEALYGTSNPELRKRAALLQRGCVHARRNDWGAALEDLEAAAGISAAGPLTRTETAICRRVLAGKHGCSAAFRSPVADRLKRLRCIGQVGPEISGALARGSFWRLKEALKSRDAAEAIRIGKFIAHTAGRAGMSDAARALEEKTQLEAEDYAW